ncbi:MAG: wax ester/triacylglycerol synthase family O-acyltransferase [Solirubrobacteraceae bacterium]
MPERLLPVTGLAHMFLGTESADYPMDGAAIIVLDPATAPDTFGFDAVRAQLAARVPPTILGRRLVRVPPFGPSYAAAYWAIDNRFDIDRHLVRIPAPADDDLGALALRLSDGMLPRDRPLWKAWFVDGLSDGRAALIMRLHHAVLDGMAGMELFGQVFDREPRPAAALMAPRPRRLSSGPLAAVPEAVALVRSVPAAARVPFGVSAGAISLVRGLASGRSAAAGESRGRLFRDTAPDCLFNRIASSPARSLGLVELPLAELKAVKNAYGVTVTDLVLALVTGALRAYLSERGEPVDRPLAAMCPMSVRSPGAQGTNQFVMMVNRLPIGLDDATVRLAAISAETAVNKRVAQAERAVADTAATLTGMLPPALWGAVGAMPDAVVGRLPPIANLQVSSIPGPPFPLYLAGAEVTALQARTFVQRGSGLFICALSYNGTMFLGATAVRELVPDPERLTELVRSELAELAELAPGPPVLAAR